MRLNLRFVVRWLIVVLVLLIAGLLWLSYNLEAVITTLVPGVAVIPTAGPTPPPPSLTAPRGELPAGHAGLEEWAQFTDGGAGQIGSGFLLRLADDDVIGVTTAHSLYLSGWPGRAVDHLVFRLPQSEENLVRFDVFRGRPGRTFTSYHFDRDYVLLQPAQLPDNAPVLAADPRGAPQPGERVVLYGGLGDGAGNPRPLAGTVTAVSAAAVWAQMDEFFEAGGLSGSPLFSAHTGQVVGMAVSAGHTAPLLVGFHPIGSIIARAAAADKTLRIDAYRP